MSSPAQKAEKIADLLAEIYPDAQCALQAGGDPWRLLVMARLSAQCTDARVNIVCRDLFREIPDAETMADTPLEIIENIVRPCGLFRTKAESIRNFSQIITEQYGGRVPDTMEDLLKLPGIGRKIANLILGDVYGKGGIVADTHCIRICGRLGFYPETLKDPARVEKILSPLLPAERQSDFCHRLVQFGRDTCMARSPQCGNCPLRAECSHGVAVKEK